ncbi:hypothetical protein FO488_17020 [Geobacter sp. FeAm09]|uniref:hypothetical protein n=1 Tax=Geobacter sp. FeAm09 TaxID=2597769 RepID=UPI0011F05833|nr:hypothetical protein [Geobacter sp. FeAm09]QEM69685.1 hypothetical protein FO488_17020 [Geobacter sp. FeAm09]
MKRRNVLAALAILGVSAAATTPAMALENEFHGMFQAQYINSNFNRTATTDYSSQGDGYYNPEGTTKKQFSSNFIEQRARLEYNAKASADLKLVTRFELDYSYYGDASYGVHRNQGAALGADEVNIETKNIYLDANIFKNVNMKLGMMANTDSFKGTVFDADMAGILLSSSYGNFSPSIGYFRFSDKGGSVDSVLGHKTNDMFMLDGKFAVTKELKVGAAYYFFRDNQVTGSNTTASAAPTGQLADGSFVYPVGTTFTTTYTTNDVKIHAFGANFEYGHGPLTVDGFALYETGWSNLSGTKTYINAFAGNLGARLKVGPGTARGEFLYVTGSDRNAFYDVEGEHGYYNNEMTILGRDKNAMTTDNSIIYNTGNKGQGLMGAYLGYDLPVNDRLATAFNVGFVGVTHKNGNSKLNATTGKVNGSNFLGTEINAEANYKLLENLNAGVRVGYAILGGYYDNVATNGTPENPYDAKIIFKYTF